MKKRLIVTPDRCIGCRSCEIACSFVHTEVNIRLRCRACASTR
jgi:Fe-S-cluster-containing hydrogenase component 2